MACLPMWLMVAVLIAFDGGPGGVFFARWFVWLVVLWVVLGYGVFGHLLIARMLWRWKRYLLTDKRICASGGFFGRHGQQLPLPDVEIHRVIPLSGSVATVQLRSRVTGAVMSLSCLEGASVFVETLRLAAGGKTVDSPVDS